MPLEQFLNNLWYADRDRHEIARRITAAALGEEDAWPSNGSERWPTSESVEGLDLGDFPELSTEERRELQREVQQFQSLARTVPPDDAAIRAQVEAAVPHFRRILGLVRKAVITEWRGALGRLFDEVEKWSTSQGWAVRRDPKRVKEGILGEYDVPVMLIHTPQNNRYILDPTARVVVGDATGRVDLCFMPSYDSAVIVRIDGIWYVLPERPGERRRRWTRRTFLNVAARLARAA
jgi:hypothetical protein